MRATPVTGHRLRYPTIACVFGYLAMLIFAFIKDFDFRNNFPVDLRNRVVGARIIDDGKSPYFYKWSPIDGIRYYDPKNFDTHKVSNITSSPLLHQVLIPIANLPQKKIAFIWLFIQYGMLIIMTVLAFITAPSVAGKNMCLLMAGMFPFTDAWERHVYVGQVYIFIPFLFSVIYFLLRRSVNWIHVVPAAAFAIMMILFRPLIVLAFTPFLLTVKSSKRFIIAGAVLAAVFFAFTITNPFQKHLHKEYRSHVAEHVRIHQKDRVEVSLKNLPDPDFRFVEGFDLLKVQEYQQRLKLGLRSENGNFFVLVRKTLNYQLSVPVMMIATLFSTIMLLFICYFRGLHRRFDLADYLIVGFIIYMMAEMLSPIHRHQYNTVQFFFPLLLFASNYGLKRWVPALMIVIGLTLNLIPWQIIDMKNTIGELLMLLGLFLAAISKDRSRPINA